ncbi:hypothetical protein ACTU3I_01415 [Microbacterium sp. RD1]|uniref:hypothetical protein n=1 Tax=Microbacterium sp. RD1 TaxID=3457313 RepID=UPI003FA54226
MAVRVGHSEALGHAVRREEWAAQGESTYVRALEALSEGSDADAVALAELTVQEAQEAFDLYRLWLVQLPALLADLGIAEAELAPARSEADRAGASLVAGWDDYRSQLARFGAEVGRRRPADARRALESARATWESVHDPATDALCGLLAVAVGAVGEECVGPLWDRMLAHYYAALPEKYAPESRPWPQSLERLVLDIFEATRGHLAGPRRDGAFEVWEEADRWVVRFAPCGSGGRTYDRSGAAASARSFTAGEYDWAWRTAGVCHYCVHCCQLQQRAPIERLGFPLRVIEPPVQAGHDRPSRSTCTWSLYKDPALLPDEAFTAVGAEVPAWLIEQRRG